MFSGAVLIIIFAFLVHNTWQKGKAVGPARSLKPRGIAGMLLLSISCLLALALWRVYEAFAVLNLIQQTIGNQVGTARLVLLVLPGVLGSVLLWFAAKLLTQGRTQLDFICANLFFWCGGPLIQAIAPWCYNASYGEQAIRSILIWISICTLVSLYLIFSPRSRNTYGIFTSKNGQSEQ